MMIKASDYIARYLYSRGVRTVYELPGGMITHMLNSLYEFQKIRVVSVHHEQAAAFAADATGRITGVPGIAMATSGPGAINLLTGIGSCHFDSSPAVFITGQVNIVNPTKISVNNVDMVTSFEVTAVPARLIFTDNANTFMAHGVFLE